MGVGAGIGQSLVPVAPAHEVRRPAVRALHLEDLALPAWRIGPVALDDQAITHTGVHLATSTLCQPCPRATGRASGQRVMSEWLVPPEGPCVGISTHPPRRRDASYARRGAP